MTNLRYINSEKKRVAERGQTPLQFNSNYWRTKDKSEVDFVFSDYYGHITPIEIKAAELRAPEINRGLKLFIEKYKSRKAVVVNLSLEKNVKISGAQVRFVLPYRMGPKEIS